MTSKRSMTKEQREWCRLYKSQTGFEALMDDFLAGNESFVVAAQHSAKWFEEWFNDAHLAITQRIPGEWE